MAIESYRIQTCMGQITQFRDQLPFLTAIELAEMDAIGYTTKTSDGVKTTREEFLNSLHKGEFSVEPTKFNRGDFIDEFLIIRVI